MDTIQMLTTNETCLVVYNYDKFKYCRCWKINFSIIEFGNIVTLTKVYHNYMYTTQRNWHVCWTGNRQLVLLSPNLRGF